MNIAEAIIENVKYRGWVKGVHGIVAAASLFVLFYFIFFRKKMMAAESSCKKDGLCSLTAQKLTDEHTIPGPAGI